MIERATPRAHGTSVLSAQLRVQDSDFRVEEIDAFTASGAGEHLLLTIEKRGITTVAAAKRIAQWAGVAESAIGYAGMKDRHAVTVQRFSVWLPKKVAPELAALDGDTLRVVAAQWHSRKLPRGALAGNRFQLRLRAVSGARDAIDARIAAIAAHGVPNYFGEQRFGCYGDNVAQALAMFAGKRVKREERSALLSAVRSELFNRVLAARVAAGTWATGIDGDVFMLDGSHSIFGPEPLDATLRERLQRGDIHPTGPLWGRGELRTQADALTLETQVLGEEACSPLRAGLEAAGMKQERRALRLPVRDLQHGWDEDALLLSFSLEPGSYATTVLAELGEVHDVRRG